MAIGDDFEVQNDKDIRYVGSTANYTVLELHRWLQDLADNAAASGDDFLDITAETPSDKSFDTIINLINSYNIDDTATHRHNTSVVLSGVTYARTIEIINGYTITFEDTGSPYTVSCVGANHNLADVVNFTSEVSLIVGNSAGLVASEGGGGGGYTPAQIADQVRTELAAELGLITLMAKYHDNITKFFGSDGTTEVPQSQAFFMVVYDNDNTTELKTIGFRNSADTPVKMSSATRYVSI